MVYGQAIAPVSVQVRAGDLVKILHAKSGEHSLITLRMGGNGAGASGAKRSAKADHPVLLHQIQHHPVDGQILHIDFHAVSLTENIKVKVGVVLKGEPVGVKQEEGVLEHFLREIEVECLPTEIPEHFELDVTSLTVGQTVHVSDLTPATNVRIVTEPEAAIAAVQKHKEEKVEEPEAAVTEPEVITEKKDEAGEEPAESAKSAKADTGESQAKPDAKAKHD